MQFVPGDPPAAEAADEAPGDEGRGGEGGTAVSAPAGAAAEGRLRRRHLPQPGTTP